MKILVLAVLLAFGTTLFSQTKAPSHEIWNGLLKKHVSSKGNVNYKGFITDSSLLVKYLNLLSATVPDEKTWSANEQKAYWINAYNAFTVKLIIKSYPVKSIKDVGAKMQIPFVNTPWDIKFIKIGKDVYDLNNLEHSKLRKKFGDARVHFGLVCASKSCPILPNEAYTAEKLEAQLETQAKVFLSDKTRNDVSADSPKLSKIFDWYSMDFKSKGVSLIDFINKYAPVKINANAKVSYLTYSWNLNE